MFSARFTYLSLIIGSRYSYSPIKDDSGAKIGEIFEAGYAQNWVQGLPIYRYNTGRQLLRSCWQNAKKKIRSLRWYDPGNFGFPLLKGQL